MSVTLGGGSLTFEIQEDWGKLPDGWTLKETPDVAVDSKDRVYAFTRGEHSVIVFDRDGTYLSSWGHGIFGSAHGIYVGPDDSVYCVDNGDHTVRKFSTDGDLLMTLGTRNQPAPRYSGKSFNKPTGIAVSYKTGDLFISDGYGNASVHRYSSEGQHIMSWGSSGIDEGQFVIPHNIAIDKADNVYVADRENHRVQIFDTDGNLQAMWNNIWKPSGIRIGPDDNVYIAELLADFFYNDAPNIGHRVSIYNKDGKLLNRLGHTDAGEELGQFISPHGIGLDSRGDIYVGEVSYTMMGRHMDPPREMRSLQKLVRKV